MNINVGWADTDDERREAALLLKKVYLDEFGLDFDIFKQVFPIHFNSDVMLIRDESGRLVGTASMLYPLEGLFPSEYIFGADITGSDRNAASKTVEVGRLAKAGDFPGGIITKAVMLETAAYLKAKKLDSWIATVRPPLYRILKSTGLNMHAFDMNPIPEGAQAEIVRKYKGNEIVVFEAAADDTGRAFGRWAV